MSSDIRCMREKESARAVSKPRRGATDDPADRPDSLPVAICRSRSPAFSLPAAGELSALRRCSVLAPVLAVETPPADELDVLEPLALWGVRADVFASAADR